MSEQTNVLGVLIWINFEYLYRHPSWGIKAVVSQQPRNGPCTGLGAPSSPNEMNFHG